MKIGIGIDTGGTYTDAVIYDFEAKDVLGSAKALTTKEDLAIGILEALDALDAKLVAQASVLALSTTLATNACVENKGGRARLIFFRGVAKVIGENGAAYGLPALEDIYIPKLLPLPELPEEEEDESVFRHPEIDWQNFRQQLADKVAGMDGIGVVELNSMWHAASAEKTAKEIIREDFDIPVVCGYELFTDLNSLQRGASTLLNARLFPVIKEFLAAIKLAMDERNLDTPKFIVRSDGSLMTDSFSYERPVETLISGPAASALGAVGLTEEKNAVIVDIGGTTTDIAIVKNGRPIHSSGGINVGKWKTFVKGLYVNTVGLGGDSAIHYNDARLILEEYRIVPICVTAAKYPAIIERLQQLQSASPHKRFLHEHLVLVRDISNCASYSEEERALCAALAERPLIIKDAAAAVNKDVYSLNFKRLVKEGVIQISGLTPTDIMHLKGDFDRYDKQASELAAGYVAKNLRVSLEQLCEMVYDEIKRKIYRNVVKVMLENEQPRFIKKGLPEDLVSFIDACYEMAKCGWQQNYISGMFRTDFSLIGVGAPTHIFLADVAKMLGTKAVIPKHFEVANAVGAVLGNFHASYQVEIIPNYDDVGIKDYTVYAKEENRTFEELEEAEAFAVQAASAAAKEEVIRHGAFGEIAIDCELLSEDTTGRDGFSVYLRSTAIAHAVGTLGL